MRLYRMCSARWAASSKLWTSCNPKMDVIRMSNMNVVWNGHYIIAFQYLSVYLWHFKIKIILKSVDVCGI